MIVGRRMRRERHPVCHAVEKVVYFGFEIRLIPPGLWIGAGVPIRIPPVFRRIRPVAGVHRSGRPVLSDRAPRMHPVLCDDEHALPSLG